MLLPFKNCPNERSYKFNLTYILLVKKDMVALQMLYFLKIKIFISLDSCQFVEYLFKYQKGR